MDLGQYNVLKIFLNLKIMKVETVMGQLQRWENEVNPKAGRYPLSSLQEV